VLLGGCAGVAEVTGTATQDDIFQLRSEIASVQQTAQRLKIDVDRLASQLDRRAGEQAQDSDRRVALVNQRLDTVNEALGKLTVHMEDLASRFDGLAQQLRAAAAPPPVSPPAGTRPASGPTALPSGGSVPPAPSATSGSSVPGTLAPGVPAAGAPSGSVAPMAPASGTIPNVPAAPPPVAAAPPSPPLRPTTGALKPQDIYQAAYIDFSKGSYSLAIAGFREFLRRFPEHELGGNGQYWIGESYLSLARGYKNADQQDKATEALTQAVVEFKKVLANYPRSDKVPTALYKEALALLELKQPEEAQARLRYLIDNFPQAEETPLARERLVSLTTG